MRSVRRSPGSELPQNSLALCIASCATPRSTVRRPVLVERAGPIVDPQAMSLRLTND